MMSLPYQLVVFDWEGTLDDPLGHIHLALQAESDRLGFKVYDIEHARQYVSLGLEKAVRKIFPELTLHQYERILLGVQQNLVTNHGHVHLFEGAEALIKQLHRAGVTLAIATNKGQQSIERALDVSGLSAFFSIIHSAGQFPAKPSPEMLEDMLVMVGCPHEQALVIGDSVSDMEMAKALEVPCVGVDFYHQQADDLMRAGAQAIFYNFKQMASYFGLE